MPQFTFNKVAVLPATLEPNNFYLVGAATDTEVDLFVTGINGSARQVGNEALIRAIASEEANALLSSGFMFEIVETIAARDALTLNGNSLVLVNDASADATVNAGAALYSFNATTDAYSKLTEFEGLDATITYENIVGRPASAVSDIDEAVSFRHQHANMAAIDRLGEAAEGFPTYAGNGIFTIGTQDW